MLSVKQNSLHSSATLLFEEVDYVQWKVAMNFLSQFVTPLLLGFPSSSSNSQFLADPRHRCVNSNVDLLASLYQLVLTILPDR